MALRGRRIDINMIQVKLRCALAKFFKGCTSQNAVKGGVCWMMCQGDNFECSTSVGRLIVVMEK